MSGVLQEARDADLRVAPQVHVNMSSFLTRLLQDGVKMGFKTPIRPVGYTTQKMKFSIMNFFSKCDQIRRNLRIWSHLLKKFLTENFIFCAEFRIISRVETSVNFHHFT